MTIKRMAVVDGANNVLNVILYDTDATWSSPEGTRIIEDGILGRGAAAPNGTWDGRKFAPPPNAPKSSPSLEERIKALEARLV